MWEGYTVTYVCLQLAYYMGFKEVVLLGVDHYYGENKQPNLEAVATGPDEHHFHPDYFANGTRWNFPDLVNSEYAYTIAKAAYEKDGRTIINATSHTALEVFNLVPFNNIRTSEPPRVSAIVSAYKAEEFIVDCLNDLHNQTEKPEIVVVCEQDSLEHDTARDRQKLRNYNIRIVTTKNVPTVYHAWNLGIREASGKYITNANTDDRHHKDAYKMMADILDVRPEIDLVYHASYISWKPNQTFDEFEKENRDVELKAGRFEGEPGYFAWTTYD
jgi:hypothetical protein